MNAPGEVLSGSGGGELWECGEKLCVREVVCARCRLPARARDDGDALSEGVECLQGRAGGRTMVVPCRLCGGMSKWIELVVLCM